MAAEKSVGVEIAQKVAATDLKKMHVIWSSKGGGDFPPPPPGKPITPEDHTPEDHTPEDHTPEQPFWQPLETNSLNQQTAENTAVIIQNQYEDSGFLNPEHPTVKTLQGYLDQMKDPNAPSTRVLIAKDTKESNAYILPDGSIILTQQLINDLDTVDEVVAVLAHEQHHFEKNHYALRNLEWEDEEFHSLKHMLDFHLGRAGLSRVHEYDAD